jgi:hypothetical protein
MIEAQDNTDRKLKRMRRIARVLAVISAIGLMPCIAVSWLVLYELMHEQSGVSALPLPPYWWLVLVFLLSVTWIPTAIAWRWEAIGGIMLIVLGLLGVIPGALAPPLCVVSSGLPLAAGALLLASWRKSRRASPTRANEGG